MRYFATRLLGGLLIAFLLAPGMALAQTAKISGEVVDAETGEPLPGANVQLEGTTKGAATNADGEYTIFQVQPGTYTVLVSFVGYQNVRRTNVEIVSGITRRLDFELQEAEFEGQEVVVRAEEELVNQTATNAVRRLGQEEIQSLPTRSPETYYSIQPGVTLQNGEIHVRGGRSNETDFLLEGISSRSLIGTDNVVPVIPEALEETQVFAGGYAADKGGANGGIVQQKLRTGGSEYSAFAQFEGDGLADSFGDTQSYGDQDAVLTVGGPITSEKYRFFVAGNYRETDDRDPRFWESTALNFVDGTGGSELCSDVSEPDCTPPVDDVTGDTADTALGWGEGGPGFGNPREEWRINGTLSLDFSPLNVRVSYAQVTRDQRQNFTPIREVFNQRRIQKREDTRRLVSVQPTYFITDNTYVEATAGFFQYDFEIFDPLLGTPSRTAGGVMPYLADLRDRNTVAEAVGVDPQNSSALAQNRYTKHWAGRFQVPDGFQFNAFDFTQPGTPEAPGYQERQQSYWNVKLNFVTQQGAHNIQFGGEWKQWTVRNYSGANALSSSLASQLQGTGNVDSLQSEIRAGASSFAREARGVGINNYGYDEFGNEVDGGPDGPKEPVTAAVYVNDKIEFENIIVNGGLRLNYFESDSYVAEDITNPPYIEEENLVVVGEDDRIDLPGLKTADGDFTLEPRLGISFPIGDKTVFHLQYGKFSQLPDLGDVYTGRGDMARIFSGGNFISDPFAWDVDPIRTTQYEIGFGRQFSEFAAFDLTAYYRRTDDQLTISRIETGSETQADPYNVFQNKNGDFSITRGLEVSVRSKRFGGVRGIFNYSLSDAKGTNSNPNSRVSALENRVPVPSQIQPLEFQQRHTGSFIVDYRTGADQPRWAANWNANLLLRFSSGHPFTRSTGGIGQRGIDDGPLLVDTDPRNRVPLEPINSSTTPWTNQVDLRLSKGFDLGPATARGYVYVQNLFDRRNANNVYFRTGSATSDGFLSTPSLSQDAIANRGQGFVQYYQQVNLDNRRHYREGFGQDLFGEPRRITLGVSVTY
jgi:hypothetical protein